MISRSIYAGPDSRYVSGVYDFDWFEGQIRDLNDLVDFLQRFINWAEEEKYRVKQRFRAHTLVQVNLETGRTHQIRVHMSYIQHPLVGDFVYGGRLRLPPMCDDKFAVALREFKRQALHAAILGLLHPVSQEHMQWQVSLPDDMEKLIALAQQDLEQHASVDH